MQELNLGFYPKVRFATALEEADSTLAPRLSQFAADNEWRLLEMRVERPTLEEIYLSLTGEEEGE